MPAPAVALAGAALRNPRRTGSSCSRPRRARPVARVPGRRRSARSSASSRCRAATTRRARASADIPPPYLELYQQAGERYGIDPWILAAIGKIETDHGRSTAPGVRSGVNAYGCCAGPMQFSLVGSPSTWDSYGVDGNRDGRRSPYDPEDAIPAAARYLRATGAPADYRRAIFAYNHADWYVADVLAQADAYRGAATGTRAGSPAETATVRELLAEPAARPHARPARRPPRRAASTRACSPRSPGSAERHTSSSPRCAPTTTPAPTTRPAARWTSAPSTARSAAARAPARCADLVRELAAVTGPTRSTELIYCWDPDARRPGHVRPRRPLRPHPLGHGRVMRLPASGLTVSAVLASR